jgi:hypothetical protein
MSTAPVQMLFPEAVTEFGFVLSRAGRTLRVDLPSGERSAEVASSCLLSPSPGDRVMVAHAGQEAYVLAVLRQCREGEAQLTFERDVSLNVLKGRLRVLAQEGVDLVSPRTVKVHAGSLLAEAEQVHASFSLLDLVGQSIVSKTKKVRVVAEAVDTVAGRIYQRAVNFLRRTDELDRVEAKNIDMRAEQLMHMHGQNAVTTAEALVKIDAGQVHVG